MPVYCEEVTRRLDLSVMNFEPEAVRQHLSEHQCKLSFGSAFWNSRQDVDTHRVQPFGTGNLASSHAKCHSYDVDQDDIPILDSARIARPGPTFHRGDRHAADN